MARRTYRNNRRTARRKTARRKTARRRARRKTARRKSKRNAVQMQEGGVKKIVKAALSCMRGPTIEQERKSAIDSLREKAAEIKATQEHEKLELRDDESALLDLFIDSLAEQKMARCRRKGPERDARFKDWVDATDAYVKAEGKMGLAGELRTEFAEFLNSLASSVDGKQEPLQRTLQRTNSLKARIEAPGATLFPDQNPNP